MMERFHEMSGGQIIDGVTGVTAVEVRVDNLRTEESVRILKVLLNALNAEFGADGDPGPLNHWGCATKMADLTPPETLQPNVLTLVEETDPTSQGRMLAAFTPDGSILPGIQSIMVVPGRDDLLDIRAKFAYLYREVKIESPA